MKADTLSLKALFQKDVRYVIPTFQRPYVWGQEQQWEPLWDDVRNAAERYLDELDAAGDDRALAEARTGSHFMGAVVVQQRPNAAAELETRDVIDGQQRLTTMQLLADAAQQVFTDAGFGPEARRLLRIVHNTYAEGDQEFKLWPTRLDRDAFRAAMRGSDDVVDFEASPIVQAHAFFRLQIREWIAAAPDDVERSRRVHGLETVLFALLELVVIDLAASDDAALIFETLNARGTPLLASDLVKNFVLQEATRIGLDGDALHRDHWQRLEEGWWREEVRQGRVLRPRLDAFLGYWLTMRTASEVQVHEVFPRFREYIESSGQPITDVVADIVRVAAEYRKLETGDAASDLQTFLRRWQILEAGVAMPVLLWLFSLGTDTLGTGARARCLTALESFLVRRTVCRLTTKDYNKLFLELLGRLHRADAGVDDVLVGYLASQQADARQWPDDPQLAAAFVELPLYRLLTRSRLRMVLEGIEDALRGPFAETRYVTPGSLTIEHIMPRSWEKHWTLANGSDPVAARAERERLLHSIGNLTLITGKLNTSQSNGPWETKRAALDAHSVLYLNKRLLTAYGERSWDEVGIRERGRALAAQASTIWPSAAAMTS